MTIILQILTIVSMLLLTYVAFNAFGARKDKLLFTAEDKRQWDETMGKRLGNWFTVTNIIGTLTSLATVYVFFLGSSKLFGYVIFSCAITIWLGAYVTNYFTRRICEDPYISSLLGSADQTGGVIASLFWRGTPESVTAARLVKWVSWINILSVIWLEFAIFADISGALMGGLSLGARTVLLGVCAFSVLLFTLRYGLRGFVFADVFQSPMIAMGALFLLGGTLYLANQMPQGLPSPEELFTPLVTNVDACLFVLQVISVNLFLVLVTESHWLRIWVFRNKVTKLQAVSTGLTAGLWALLALAGLYAYQVTGQKLADTAIIDLLSKLNRVSPAFLVAFWVGGMGALFSTADSQIYSFLLVQNFDPVSGRLREARMTEIAPFRLSLLLAMAFCLFYYLIRVFGLPFEKIIFTILPVCLNLVPGMVILATKGRGVTWAISLCLLLYGVFSVLGFLQPQLTLTYTLIAPAIPVLVSVVLFIANSKKE